MQTTTSLRSDQKTYLLAIRDLIEYIETESVTPAELCQFIAHETLKQHDCSILYLSRLDTDGVIRPIADFGIPEASQNAWDEVPVTAELPITDAIKNDDIVWFNNYSDLWDSYPQLANFPRNEEVKSFVAMPVDVEGWPKVVVGLMFNTTLRQDPDLLMFIWTIGALVSMYLSQHWRDLTPKKDPNYFYFTLRQRDVLQMLADGLTNSQIANQLGFSESTIRHETMRIYRALQVDGRKEAISFAIKNGLITR